MKVAACEGLVGCRLLKLCVMLLAVLIIESIEMKKLLLGLLLLGFGHLALAEGKLSADFLLKDMAGVSHQLSRYQGKWVLVNYWATWCPPCLEEVPDLVNLYDSRKKKDLMVIGVVFDYQDVEEVKAYVDDMLMSYPIVLGDDAVIDQIGPAEAMPTTFIYNPKGELITVKRGLITRQYIEKLIGKAKK